MTEQKAMKIFISLIRKEFSSFCVDSVKSEKLFENLVKKKRRTKL